MKDDQIKGYFAFDESDLLANRSGRLSAKQRKQIKEVDQFAERFVLGMFLVFLIGGLIFAYFALSARTSITSWIWTGVFLVAAVWAFRGVSNKVDNSIQKVEGEVHFVKVEKQSGSAADPSYKRTTVSSYEMRVNDEAFGNANPALIEHMQGDVYVIYFTKSTRRILSVEFISKGK